MNKIEYVGKCLVVEVEGKKILVVGDLHLGYGEAMQVRGVSVGEKEFSEVINEFEEIFEKIRDIDEVVLLGDIKHEFGKILNQERRQIERLNEWFFGRGVKKVLVMRGNHDALFDFMNIGGLEVLNKYVVGEMCFFHGDKVLEGIEDKGVEVWIIGHGHPAVMLREGVKEERYKCFLEGEYEGKKIIILPSFSEHSIGSDPREGDLGFKWKFNFDKFKVRIVGEKLEVIDFGKLGKIK